jgi:chromosome segregation ATPase
VLSFGLPVLLVRKSLICFFFLKGLETQKEDVLQQELEDMNAKLDMYTQTNSGVIDQYERRKLEIANLQKTIASREQQEQALAATIKTAQDNWQPRLEELVNSIGARFSAAFDSKLLFTSASSK